jgi:bacteriorhodopsin
MCADPDVPCFVPDVGCVPRTCVGAYEEVCVCGPGSVDTTQTIPEDYDVLYTVAYATTLVVFVAAALVLLDSVQRVDDERFAARVLVLFMCMVSIMSDLSIGMRDGYVLVCCSVRWYYAAYANWLFSLPALAWALPSLAHAHRVLVCGVGLVLVAADGAASAICVAERRWILFGVSALVLLLAGGAFLRPSESFASGGDHRSAVGALVIAAVVSQLVWVMSYGIHQWSVEYVYVFSVVIDGVVKLGMAYGVTRPLVGGVPPPQLLDAAPPCSVL